MREIFHGWKRKAGAVTLLGACVLLCGWMRSTVVTDVLAPNRRFLVASVDSRLAIAIDASKEWGSPEWRTEEHTPLEDEFDERFFWIWRGGGAGVCFSFSHSEGVLVSYVPYWLIVLPLTILAAVLLLSPRLRRG